MDKIGSSIVDAALAVHRALGPGLLESTYEHCLVAELEERGLIASRQVAMPVIYRNRVLDAGYRLDILVNGDIVIEVKSVAEVLPIHHAQLITYLRLSGHKLGYLINFNVVLLKNGLKRIIV